MKNTKAILAGTLMAPVLALTGGIAYASAATPSHPAPARATVTATAQHPIGQDRFGWCDWRYTGHWGDWRGHGYQAQPAHEHRAARHHGYQHRAGYRTWGNQGHGYRGNQSSGYQGGWGYGYQGNGYQSGWGRRSGSHWGSGGGCCRHGW